jgi:hypothetical protein
MPRSGCAGGATRAAAARRQTVIVSVRVTGRAPVAVNVVRKR